MGEFLTGEPGTDTNDYLMGLQMIGVGAGVDYHFMPTNTYLSGSLLFHKVAFDRMTNTYDDGISESKGAIFNESPNLAVRGYATNLMAGKEWWVSPQWGLGVAVHLVLGTADNRALDHGDGQLVHARWFSVSLGLLLSATYN